MKILIVVAAIAVAFIMMMMLPGTLGLEYRYYCLDDGTLQKEAVINTNISGTDETFVINQSIICEYGCDDVTNTCQPPEFQQTLAVVTILIIFIIIGFGFWKWSGR